MTTQLVAIENTWAICVSVMGLLRTGAQYIRQTSGSAATYQYVTHLSSEQSDLVPPNHPAYIPNVDQTPEPDASALLSSRDSQRSYEIITPTAALASHRPDGMSEGHVAEQMLKINRSEMAGDLTELACDSHQLASAVRLAKRLLHPPHHENGMRTYSLTGSTPAG
jgi:hypothetical protein